MLLLVLICKKANFFFLSKTREGLSVSAAAVWPVVGKRVSHLFDLVALLVPFFIFLVHLKEQSADFKEKAQGEGKSFIFTANPLLAKYNLFVEQDEDGEKQRKMVLLYRS